MKIEKGVPLPEAGPGRKSADNPYAALLKEMEVGDSFVTTGLNMATLQTRVRRVAKQLGVKITCRPEGEQNEGRQARMRVWRLDDSTLDAPPK